MLLCAHTADAEELSHRALVLIEENLRLRALLLTSASCDESQSHHSEEQQPTVQQVEHREEVVHLLADKEVEEEKGDLDRGVSPSVISSNGSSEGQKRGHSDMCERGEGRRERRDDGEVAGEATAEQVVDATTAVCEQVVDDTIAVCEQVMDETTAACEQAVDETLAVHEQMVNETTAVCEQAVDETTAACEQAVDETKAVHEQMVDETTAAFEQAVDKTTAACEQAVDETMAVHEQMVDETTAVHEQVVNGTTTVHEHVVDGATAVCQQAEDETTVVTEQAVDETTTVCEQAGGESKGAASEQLWPISSLLSDNSRTGSRDHTTFNLPILSPTYIAEHCSAAVCEQHFFPPPPFSSSPNVSNFLETDCSDAQCSRTPFHVATTTAPNAMSTGNAHSTVSATPAFSVATLPLHTIASSISSTSDGSIPSVALVPLHTITSSTSPSSISSVSTLPSNTTTACTSSASAISHARRHPRSRSTPSYHTSPLTRPSIVQPWVGHNSSGSRKTQNTTVLGSSPTRQTFCSSPQLTAGVEIERLPPPENCRVRVRDSSQHNRASVLHYTNRHHPQYRPLSVQSRTTVPNSGHMCGSQYPNTCQHCNVVAASVPGSFSHSNLSQETALCSETTSSYQSTGSSFPLHTAGSLNPSPMMFQPPGFPADPYFNHTVHPSSQNPLSHHHPHTRHNSHAHPSLTHHHVVHQHNYNIPPRPHHPTPPTPSFTSHHHHPHHTPPSHHNTVWRPYSDRQRTSTTRFSLSDILSPSPATSPTLVLPAHAQQSPSGRVPSFFVDHLLDDL